MCRDRRISILQMPFSGRPIHGPLSLGTRALNTFLTVSIVETNRGR